MMELERKFSWGEWSQLSEDDVKQHMINDMAIQLARELYNKATVAVYQNIELDEFTVKVIVDTPKQCLSELDEFVDSVPLFKDISENGQTEFFIDGQDGKKVNVTEIVNVLKGRDNE